MSGGADNLTPVAAAIAALGAGAALAEGLHARGKYTAVLRDAEGRELNRWEFPNLVTTQGKNHGLDSWLRGSGYTAAFYLGLISSASYTAVAAADTAASHAGWLEAGGTNAPTYTGPRKTVAFGVASAGASAITPVVFTFTGSGTVKGCALWATASALDATTGSLISAGLFTGGDQPVVATNTLTVSYSLSL